MSIKSAEEYREEARRVRALAIKAVPTVQAALLDVAATYEDLARQADYLAKLKFAKPIE